MPLTELPGEIELRPCHGKVYIHLTPDLRERLGLEKLDKTAYAHVIIELNGRRYRTVARYDTRIKRLWIHNRLIDMENDAIEVRIRGKVKAKILAIELLNRKEDVEGL